MWRYVLPATRVRDAGCLIMEIVMFAGTINGTENLQAIKDDPICLYVWGYDPAEYFEYLTSPGNSPNPLEKSSSFACRIKAAIESVSKSANTREY